MCGRKLKLFSVLLVLFSLLCFSPLCSTCYADVRLTDKEAEQILNEIEESRKELETVKNDCKEQKTSYEMQLSEAEKKNSRLKKVVVATSSSTTILLIVTILLIAL